jgi:hypothetical protein
MNGQTNLAKETNGQQKKQKSIKKTVGRHCNKHVRCKENKRGRRHEKGRRPTRIPGQRRALKICTSCVHLYARGNEELAKTTNKNREWTATNKLNHCK